MLERTCGATICARLLVGSPTTTTLTTRDISGRSSCGCVWSSRLSASSRDRDRRHEKGAQHAAMNLGAGQDHFLQKAPGPNLRHVANVGNRTLRLKIAISRVRFYRSPPLNDTAQKACKIHGASAPIWARARMTGKISPADRDCENANQSSCGSYFPPEHP
jgi:hypothetical protein